MWSMTLRYLAGGAWQDITRVHKVAQSTFEAKVKLVIAAIIAVVLPGAVEMSYDADWLHEKEKVFARKSGGAVHGCIGALDGLAISIRMPTKGHSDNNPQGFRNRKGFYSLNLQAMCDADRRFMFLGMDAQGSTHDSLAFEMSWLKIHLNGGKLPAGYWIAGDDAYLCTESLLTPFTASQLQSAQPSGMYIWVDSFNAHLTQCRNVIECAFGILVRRWGVLWRPMEHPPAVCADIVPAVAALHNTCISYRLALSPAHVESDADVLFETADGAACNYREAGTRELYLNSDGVTDQNSGARRDTAASAVREAVVGHLQQHGLQRIALPAGL